MYEEFFQINQGKKIPIETCAEDKNRQLKREETQNCQNIYKENFTACKIQCY